MAAENGGSHPPKNKIAHKVLIKIMFAYSPRKKSANPIEEYSTLYPATNSASASGKSKGARLVSAKHETKNMINNGNRGKPNHTCDCAYTISDKFREPAHKSTEIMINPMETSYDIICAADRKPPRKAYLEFDDQPAVMIPYTPNDEIANTYSTPTCTSANTIPSPKGMTDQATKLRIKVTSGALINTTVFAFVGKTGSLRRSFTASAIGCKIPKIPTTFGPFRLCIAAIILRSASVKKATAIISGSMIPMMESNSHTISDLFMVIHLLSSTGIEPVFSP